MSVVIPVHDRADLLSETLESVRSQTFQEWECLVVDDGSTDGTPEVARAWEERDPRFRYVRQEQAGAGAARNTGVARARGDLIAFLDSDDLFVADKLEWQVAALDRAPDAVMAYGNTFHFHHEAPDRGYEYLARRDEKPSGEAFEELLTCSAIYAPLVRAEAVEHAGGFDEELPSAEDWDMWLRVARQGPVVHEPRIALRYRLHEGGKSTNVLRNYRCARGVLERHLPAVPAARRTVVRKRAMEQFRASYPPKLREEAVELAARNQWDEARSRWRALAALAPGRLRHPPDLVRAAWSFLPTRRPPPLQGLRRIRRLAGPGPRHRLAAELRARTRRVEWSLRAARLRRPEGGEGGRRPLVGIALVDHMGDLVAAQPVARHLRREHPEATLVWVVREPYRSIPEAFGEVDRVWTVSCLTEWIRLREHVPFDRTVDLHVRGRSCGICQEPLEKEEGDAEVHIGNYYRHGALLEVFCRSAGLPVLREGPRLSPPAGARAAVDRLDLPDDFVCIHGRSAQEARDWRTDRWRELAGRLVEEVGVPVVEVGLEPVLEAGSGRVDLCGALSILETAEVVRRARLFVGIDSGPAHLANAVGTPGVLLLGHYRSYERYRPWTGSYGREEDAEVVWGDGPASEIEVATALRAVRRALDRSGARESVEERSG